MSFDIDITIQPGERPMAVRIVSDARLTALVGPSGVGKTSALNAIAGLAKPLQGHVNVAGQRMFDEARGIDLPPEKRRAGYVFQDTRLFPHRTVAANLAFAGKFSDRTQAPIDHDETVRLLEIGHLLNRYPANLSGGEARRVAIGRALLSAPRFLLLDEPAASLDPARAEALLALIERLRDTIDLPIMLVSHSAAEVERLAGAVVEMGS
ncbi:ATP-binding cassette domain-containing protein [Aurantiacibacter gangjinensis]|uniref:Molybdenum ABC transporter ATP-binding protein n=1 Tax=Aurantiacibacter gangjinensis TaxID=502682 RepID=A0A0G9MK51_9SPHN|nr:ATP-binding cassette domain-containing protein [Aurantiacibacter gangjinensis]APE29347.1 Molybdenum transport ATP-binding protein ModC [Aurantiacibacter gangjinensis]KLE31070.1 molybdenum ABC transporter ATP-binding protein [Aurantiacibacter gangjinensis]